MTTIQFFQNLLDWLLADPAHIVAAASALAAATPTPAANSTWGKVYKVLDILAINVIHAKDSGPTPGAPSPAAAPAVTVGPAVMAALLIVAGLSACARQTPAAEVFELRAGYDAAVLVPVSHYAALPACPQADNAPCADPAVLGRLRKADAAAKAALDAAEDSVRNHPQTDSSAAIAAADAAVAAARTIVATQNLK
ncbi:MAG: hypothetical protein M0006_16075 [Magnetospirillum sp.]|nr:hypothetical protein [Magnetospirillum sp.]